MPLGLIIWFFFNLYLFLISLNECLNFFNFFKIVNGYFLKHVLSIYLQVRWNPAWGVGGDGSPQVSALSFLSVILSNSALLPDLRTS